jgi:capsular exopolysaccharide synthesis family protein
VHLPRQLSIVLARLPLILSTVVVAAAGSFFLTSLQPKVYEANATLIVGQALTAVNPDYNQLLVSQRLSSTYATVATTRPVLERVVERLGLRESADALARRISAAAATDGALLTISARDGDSNRAASLANTVAEELIAASPAVQGAQTEVLESIDEDLRAIQQDIAIAQEEIQQLTVLDSRTSAQEVRLDTLRGRVVALRSTYATLLSFAPSAASNLMSIIQPATAPTDSVSPRPLLYGGLGAVVAFLIVSAIIFLVEYLDDAIRDPEQVESTMGLVTLAAIERMTGGHGREPIYRMATLLYPRSTTAEAYRALRTNVEFAAVDRPIRTLLVTSAVPSEGKTVTAANLAVVFAQGGRRVLLVDADLRKPGVHEMFASANDMGLTDLLRGEGTDLRALAKATEQKNLDILTGGRHPPNPAELLGSQRMRGLVKIFSESYDLVIFDSPPLDVFADSAVLSSFLDGSILVIEVKRGRRRAIRAAHDALTRANANILGVVLNGLAQKGPAEYGRYYGSNAEAGRDPAAAHAESRDGALDGSAR